MMNFRSLHVYCNDDNFCNDILVETFTRVFGDSHENQSIKDVCTDRIRIEDNTFFRQTTVRVSGCGFMFPPLIPTFTLSPSTLTEAHTLTHTTSICLLYLCNTKQRLCCKYFIILANSNARKRFYLYLYKADTCSLSFNFSVKDGRLIHFCYQYS
jgi:hypothetical protein